MPELSAVYLAEPGDVALDHAYPPFVQERIVDGIGPFGSGGNHEVNDFPRLGPGRVDRYQHGPRPKPVGDHKGIPRVVDPALNEVADVGHQGNQRVDQRVLAAE